MSFFGFLYQQRVDVFLGQGVLAGEFADRDEVCPGLGQSQKFFGTEMVVQDYVGLSDDLMSLECD